MNALIINHHQIQEGDAYGLIYALQLSKALGVPDSDKNDKVYGLFYISGEDYKKDVSYQQKIIRRLDYFKSFGLLGTRFKIALCYDSSEQQQVFTFAEEELQVKDQTLNCLSITVKKSVFERGKGQQSQEDEDDDLPLKVNPRHVSTALTNAENPAGGLYDKLSEAILKDTRGDSSDALKSEGGAKTLSKQEKKERALKIRAEAKPLMEQNRREFGHALAGLLAQDEENRGARNIEVKYGYISKSTDYVGHCIRQKSFLKVAGTLRALILDSTREYESANQKFLDDFMDTLVNKYFTKRTETNHYSWQKFSSKAESNEFLIILFWVRGAKRDEHDAIFEGGGSVGKPQHHTNLSLYKYIRALTHILGKELNTPLLFVPIGDKLEETTLKTALGPQDFTKGQKDYNLIEFFKKPTFEGKPMGAQINFLLQLAMKHQVVQVGMRSGSMERLMYLGVPTIYFDRTEKYGELPSPVGATRIRQLSAFADKQKPSKDTGGTPDEGKTEVHRDPEKSKQNLVNHFLKWHHLLEGGVSMLERNPTSGYPLFFQVENMDTGFLRYSAFSPTWSSDSHGWTKVDSKWVQDESWSRTPGSRVEKSITKLVTTLNKGADASISKHDYNLFKKRLLGHGYLRDNLEASRRFLNFGALDEVETLKLCSMIWFISVVYPAYQGMFSDSPLPIELGKSSYATRFDDAKKSFYFTFK